jgi:hypothetical protein
MDVILILPRKLSIIYLLRRQNWVDLEGQLESMSAVKINENNKRVRDNTDV